LYFYFFNLYTEEVLESLKAVKVFVKRFKKNGKDPNLSQHIENSNPWSPGFIHPAEIGKYFIVSITDHLYFLKL
jgi:hypothetical protein